MKELFDRWEALCASSAILRFVDINLRGVGQVMFQDNPLTGLLFLAAVGLGIVRCGRAGGLRRRCARRRDGDAFGALAQGRQADAERRPLRL